MQAEHKELTSNTHKAQQENKRTPDYLSLYRRHVNNLKPVGSGPEHIGECPFPECRGKTEPKFYTNEISGQFICHRCGAKGNAITFSKNFGENYRRFYDVDRSAPEIDLQAVERWNRYLMDRPDLWREPWTETAVRRLQVGWDPRVETTVFPIFDEKGNITNIIHHKRFQIKGSTVTMYPHHLLHDYDPQYLLIVEGLPDVITGLSQGFQVVTSTAGASAIPTDLSCLTPFSKAYLIPHNDKPGEDGAQRWIRKIRTQVPSLRLRIGDLSPFVGERGDLTDYFNVNGKSRTSFIHEVLKPASVATLYSDLPSFIRDQMLSPEFVRLKPEDQAVYCQIAMRAARYRVPTIYYRGQIRIPPGGFWTRYSDLIEYCPFLKTDTGSNKPIRTCINRLIKTGFIQKQNLNWRRGLLITLRGWSQELQGHRERHRNPFTEDLVNFPAPPFWKRASELEESED